MQYYLTSCWFAATAPRLAHERECLSLICTSIISYCEPDKALVTNMTNVMVGKLVECMQKQSIGVCPCLFHMAKLSSRCGARLCWYPWSVCAWYSFDQDEMYLTGLVNVHHSPNRLFEHKSHDISISSAPWPLFFRSSDLFCVAAFASSTHFS